MTTSQPSADAKGIVTKVSPRSVTDTADRLSEILRSRGLVTFAIIDQRAEARKVGMELRETIMVICGSPAAGTPIMEHAPLSALDLPLKVLIWDDGGTTKVSYVSPAELVARYDLPADLGGLAGINTIADALAP